MKIKPKNVIIFIVAILVAILLVGFITTTINNAIDKKHAEAFKQEITPQIEEYFNKNLSYLKLKGVDVTKDRENFNIIVDLETPFWIRIFLDNADEGSLISYKLALAGELQYIANNMRGKLNTTKPFVISIKATNDSGIDVWVDEFGDIIEGINEDNMGGGIDTLSSSNAENNESAVSSINRLPSLFDPQ